MSLDLIDHNEPSLDVREFLSLGDELGSDPELGGLFSHEATILARLLWCNLSDSLGRRR